MQTDELYKATRKIANQQLLSARSSDFRGYDPYDFLNSTLFNKMRLQNSKLVRLAWIQLGKKLPWNFRSLIGVSKERNPKGIALFILGMIEDHKRTGNVDYINNALSLADWLLGQQCDKNIWEHSCWGYHFDWQARAFYVPKGKPNIITTSYVARSLYELGKITGRDDYIQSALDSADFIQKHLLQKDESGYFYGYIPGESAFVHNASLWGAAWCTHVSKKSGNDTLRDMALTIAHRSANDQLQNGAWTYGSRPHHQFIDGFHTGYNLEALHSIRKALKVNDFDEAISKGMSYYKDTFFLNNGIAKYYSDKTYPLDMHSFAQGILTLLTVGQTKHDVNLAKKIVSTAINTMYSERRGLFIYQKNRWITNKINYIRWTQAWAYYSFSCFNRHMEDKHGLPHSKQTVQTRKP